MKRRDAAAARLEAEYIARVRSALAGRETSEIDEIVQSVREHIESELSDAPGVEVSEVKMSNVLEQLGPPQAYSESDGNEAGARPPKTDADTGFTWNKKTVLIISGLITLGVGLLGLLLAGRVGISLVAFAAVVLVWAFRPRAAMLLAFGLILLCAVGMLLARHLARMEQIRLRNKARSTLETIGAGVRTYQIPQTNDTFVQTSRATTAPQTQGTTK